MTDAITVHGLKEVQKSLYKYSQQLGDRVVYGALRQGANLMSKAIRREITSVGIKTRTGKLQKSWKIIRSKIHRGQLSTDMIGVYVALSKGKDSAFYGRFLNDGWNSHGKRVGWSKARSAAVTKRSGRVTTAGRDISGKHFIQKSFEANKESSARLIVRSAESGAALLARKVGL